MQMISTSGLLALVILLTPSPPLKADGFYRDKARGWFWREAIDGPVEAPQPPLTPPPQTPPTPQKERAPLAPPAPERHSAAWFRQHLPEIRDRALDEPSLEHVMAFYQSQKILMDKANRFAEVSRTVVMADPSLDETARRPLSPFGVHAAEEEARSATQSLLSGIARESALVFFFLSDCRFCALEAPLLKQLADLFGFRILPVSIDHKPLQGGLFPDFRPDDGQARRLQVVATPALFLIHPKKGVAPIGQGLLSMDEMTSRLLIEAEALGIISKRDLDSSRGLRSPGMPLQDALDTSGRPG